MNKQAKARFGLVGLCALFAATAVADISVTTRPFDDTTGGDWRGKYGSCYSVVPWAPRTVFPEIQVGPDFQGIVPAQYRIPDPPSDAQCISGPGKAYFDFRIYTDSSPAPNPGHAFVWGFDDPVSPPSKWSVATGTPQWNPCLGASGAFYPAGWDSDDFDFEPLSAEIELKTGGNATVAFYLLSAETTCRSQDYRLYIDNNLEASGTVLNLSIGRYLVFDIEGLPEAGSKIRLETEEIEGGNDLKYCNPTDRVAENSFVNGIFVDGTYACDFAGCTPGFWKNIRKHLPAWVIYTPGQQFSAVFENAFPGMTLEDVLRQGGGGLKALGRHTVAALLNGANSDINSGMTAAEVIDAFNDVYPGTWAEYTALKNEFAEANELGCPINGKSAPE